MTRRQGYVSGTKVFVIGSQLSLLWLVWYGVVVGTDTTTSAIAWMDFRSGIEAAQSGDYASSIERFDRVVQLVPEASNAYLVKACAHAGQDDIEAAALAFHEGLEPRLPNLVTPPCWDALVEAGLRLALAGFIPVPIVVPEEPSSLESLAWQVIEEGQEDRDAVAVLAGSVCLHSEQGLDQLADANFVHLARIVSEDWVGHSDIIDCVDQFFERAYPGA